ncbi:Germacrene C synthase [Capsicum chinense]|nr:Germacrene C synthase [Capsicum chinense]
MIIIMASYDRLVIDSLSGFEEISTQEKLELEELKEKVRKMLVETPDNSTQKLVLIDAIQRLGVAYHFKNEIKTSIQNIFDESEESNKDDDLYVVALRFRLVRQQRHYLSSDVFEKFTNHDGKFKETLTKDVQGLLSLYEAAQLRVHGEEILEEALSFTITHLESMIPILSNLLKDQVREALSESIHTNLPRITARKYICIYENINSHNKLLLRFAKLDFNIVQKVHQKELGELTRWWKDLDFSEKFSYARDRLVECHFYSVGVYFEPGYSRARELLTKVLTIYTIIDDTYDAYATYDELVPFTDAIDRCDISAMDSVPHSLRHTYQALVDIYTQIEEKFTKERTLERLYYVKYEMKKLARAFFKEAQWLNAGRIPKCEEYMKNANVTTTCMMAATTSLSFMKEAIAKETFEWIINEPLILRASSAINRLKGDIIGHDLEQQRKHIASFIECYMKEYRASRQEANAEVEKNLTNAWKDMNTEFLHSTHEIPMWWKDLDFSEKFSYARDRLVECHFYSVGVYFEPEYSRARELLTKVLTIYTIIDDTYDAYATYDELVPFTDAIDRSRGMTRLKGTPYRNKKDMTRLKGTSSRGQGE